MEINTVHVHTPKCGMKLKLNKIVITFLLKFPTRVLMPKISLLRFIEAHIEQEVSVPAASVNVRNELRSAGELADLPRFWDKTFLHQVRHHSLNVDPLLDGRQACNEELFVDVHFSAFSPQFLQIFCVRMCVDDLLR